MRIIVPCPNNSQLSGNNLKNFMGKGILFEMFSPVIGCKKVNAEACRYSPFPWPINPYLPYLLSPRIGVPIAAK